MLPCNPCQELFAYFLTYEYLTPGFGVDQVTFYSNKQKNFGSLTLSLEGLVYFLEYVRTQFESTNNLKFYSIKLNDIPDVFSIKCTYPTKEITLSLCLVGNKTLNSFSMSLLEKMLKKEGYILRIDDYYSGRIF